MIEFHSKTDFNLEDQKKYSHWITGIIESEEFVAGDIDYIFCNDEFLLSVNIQYLGHDTYTDIITFDYTNSKTISGDIFISIERVNENADKFEVTFEDELLRVMSHGVLHLMGYSDKSDDEIGLMRAKEEEKIKMFHVEQ